MKSLDSSKHAKYNILDFFFLDSYVSLVQYEKNLDLK